MEFVFGIVGKDFTLLLTDGNAARSVICYQQEHDKIIPINKFNALAMPVTQVMSNNFPSL